MIKIVYLARKIEYDRFPSLRSFSVKQNKKQKKNVLFQYGVSTIVSKLGVTYLISFAERDIHRRRKSAKYFRNLWLWIVWFVSSVSLFEGREGRELKCSKRSRASTSAASSAMSDSFPTLTSGHLQTFSCATPWWLHRLCLAWNHSFIRRNVTKPPSVFLAYRRRRWKQL